MECIKDIKTGIIRHTYGTVYPKECKEIIAESGLVGSCYVNGVKTSPNKVKPADEALYDVAFRGRQFNIISTGTRTIIVGTSDREMIELFKVLRGEEWEYDNLSVKTDFV